LPIRVCLDALRAQVSISRSLASRPRQSDPQGRPSHLRPSPLRLGTFPDFFLTPNFPLLSPSSAPPHGPSSLSRFLRASFSRRASDSSKLGSGAVQPAIYLFLCLVAAPLATPPPRRARLFKASRTRRRVLLVQTRPASKTAYSGLDVLAALDGLLDGLFEARAPFCFMARVPPRECFCTARLSEDISARLRCLSPLGIAAARP